MAGSLQPHDNTISEVKAKGFFGRIWESTVFAVGTPRRTFRFLGNVYRNGYYEVITTFSYQDKEFSFRTSVQPDADVMIFVPDINAHVKNKEWFKLYREKFYEHQVNTHDFLKVLVRNEKVWLRAFDVGITAANVVPIAKLGYDYYANSDGLTIGMTVLGIAVGAGVIYFRKKLRKYIVMYGMRFIIGGVRLVKRIRKRRKSR